MVATLSNRNSLKEVAPQNQSKLLCFQDFFFRSERLLDASVREARCCSGGSFGPQGTSECLKENCLEIFIEFGCPGWDQELYYSKEPQKGKTYARHGGFVEASEMFVNKTGNTDPTWAMDGKRSWWIEEISDKYFGIFLFSLGLLL